MVAIRRLLTGSVSLPLFPLVLSLMLFAPRLSSSALCSPQLLRCSSREGAPLQVLLLDLPQVSSASVGYYSYSSPLALVLFGGFVVCVVVALTVLVALVTVHSLFFILYSLFFILYSLFFILYSLFFILYSLFFILYSLFLFFILYSSSLPD